MYSLFFVVQPHEIQIKTNKTMRTHYGGRKGAGEKGLSLKFYDYSFRGSILIWFCLQIQIHELPQIIIIQSNWQNACYDDLRYLGRFTYARQKCLSICHSFIWFYMKFGETKILILSSEFDVSLEHKNPTSSMLLMFTDLSTKKKPKWLANKAHIYFLLFSSLKGKEFSK